MVKNDKELKNIVSDLQEILNLLNIENNSSSGDSDDDKQDNQSEDNNTNDSQSKNEQENQDEQNNQDQNNNSDLEDLVNQLEQELSDLTGNNNSNNKTLADKYGVSEIQIGNQKIDLTKIKISDLQDVKDYVKSDFTNMQQDTDTNAIIEAAAEAQNKFENKHPGTGHSNMLRVFEQSKIVYPTWVYPLFKILRPSHNMAYTWSKASKNRMTRATDFQVLQKGSYKEKDKLKHLLIAIDVSGSISNEQLSIFYSQVKGLLNSRKKVEGLVCYWDTQIASSGPFKDYKSFEKVPCKGGGGTDPTCAFEFGIKNKCQYIVVFTDGCFQIPPEKYAKEYKQVFWVIPNKNDYDRFKKEGFPYGKLYKS